MPHWLPPFLVATAVAFVAVPRIRQRTLSQEVVQHIPESSTQPQPPRAGVAVVFALLVSLLLEPRLRLDAAVLVLSAVLLAVEGVSDDDGAVSRAWYLLVDSGVAVVAVVVGVQVHASGSGATDIVLSVIWIVLVTNAFRCLDDMDGAATGTAAVTSVGIFLLAVLAGQPVVTTFAAATVGACLAFLVYNRPPAWVRLGSDGSRFLGFVLGVLTLSSGSAMSPALALTVPVFLLAVPLLDAVTVMWARFRRGLPISAPRRDHLYHRLLVRGWSPARALTSLIAAEVALVALALLAGRGVVPLGTAGAGVGVVLGALGRAALRVPMYAQPVHRRSRRLRWAAVLLVVGPPVLSAPAVISILRAVEPARTAERTARHGVTALEAGDRVAAVDHFDLASAQFATARHRLDGFLPNLAMAVPGVSANLAAAKTLVSVGQDLASAGSAMAQAAGPAGMPIRDGSVMLDEVRRLTPVLVATSASLERSVGRLDSLERAILVPKLSRAVDEVGTLLRDRRLAVRSAAEAARLLPDLLGEKAARRYFLAFQNNSEIRGTGGLIGNWGVLMADGGRLHVERFGRLGELQAALIGRGAVPVTTPTEQRSRLGAFRQWQQVNVSPDFPTTAKAIEVMYAQSGGEPIDGVIAVDPIGLSGLLQLTGPVSVGSWPEPITSANVVDVTLVRAYERYPVQQDEMRIAFLSDLARAVTEAFTTRHLGTAAQLVRALGPAVQGRHLMIYSGDPRAQALLGDIGADGGMPALQGDALMLVNQNMAGNKLDTYLRRQVRYEIGLAPRKGTVAVSGRADISLTNDVPSLDLPEAVVGPYLPQFQRGENRTYLSVYSPFLAGPVLLDGQVVDADTDFDPDRPTRSTAVSLAAGQTRTLSLSVDGRAALGAGVWYRLDLLRQPVLTADDVTVVVTVPKGWQIGAVRGASAQGTSRTKTVHVKLTRPATLWFKLEATGANRLWDAVLQ